MRVCPSLLLCVLVVLYLPQSFADDSGNSFSPEKYATCAACHLPDGAGVPSAFPPLRNRAAAIADLEGGRDYLITVVSYGLMGNVTIDGTPYFGVMAGNTGAMSADEIAAALNYVVFELTDSDTSEIDPFTAEEVAAVQSTVTPKSPAAGASKRVALINKHGEL